MIESQLELVKKEEWDDLLQPPASEKPVTNTINEVKSELEQKDEVAEVPADSDPVDDNSEGYEEGMTPAVELPNV